MESERWRIGSSVDFTSNCAKEADGFADETTVTQWWIGRGFGGAYVGIFGANMEHGFPYVHYGHLFIVLKGGIMLLALLSGSLVVGVLAGLRSKDPESVGGACYLILVSLIDLAFPQVQATPGWALYGVSLGMALRRRGDDEEVATLPGR